MNPTGRFRQTAPDRLQATEGGGCLALFGLPFLAAGLFVTLLALGVVPVSNRSDLPWWAWPLFLLMGLTFTAAGGALVLGRRWVTLDAGRRILRREWGLLRPMRGEEQGLQGCDAVLLRFESGGSDSAGHYPILLRAAAGGADLSLIGFPQYGEAHEQAVAVAKLLGLPLVDATTDHPALSAAEHADATLRERLEAGNAREEAAARPLRMRSEVRETGRGVEILLPGPGFRLRALIGPIGSLCLLVYLLPDLLDFFRRSRTPEEVQLFFSAVLVLILLVAPLLSVVKAALRARRGGLRVTASPEGIVLEERTLWRIRVTRIPAAEILGLDYGTAEGAFRQARRDAEERGRGPGTGRELPPWLALVRRLVVSRGVLVKSRSRIIPIGAGLPDEEIRYLYTAIRRALGGADGGRW